MSFLPRIFIVLLTLCLASCSGWHLRGSQTNLSTNNLSNAVALSGVKSPSYQTLLAQLKTRDLLSTGNAQIEIILAAERWQSRTASLNTEGLAAETELRLQVPYQIVQKQTDSAEAVVLRDSQVNVNRSYTADAADIGAKQKEENELRLDMSNAAALAILRSLSLINRQ